MTAVGTLTGTMVGSMPGTNPLFTPLLDLDPVDLSPSVQSIPATVAGVNALSGATFRWLS